MHNSRTDKDISKIPTDSSSAGQQPIDRKSNMKIRWNIKKCVYSTQFKKNVKLKYPKSKKSVLKNKKKVEIQIDPCEKFQISESFSQIGQNKWLWILINGLILDRKTLTEYLTAKHL